MEIKEAILSWIINLNKDYNYINKRFQDTVMNYFLEDYIAPLLMQDYNLQVYREIHVILKNKLKQEKDRILPKYMGILNIYTNELKDKNRYSEYKRKLCQIIQEETSHSSSNFNSQMWKKLVAFLLLEHSVNNNIKNFNGMWQSAFPDRPLKKVKLPKYSKNNTSYYKKRMLILKQKELEFDYQQNLKNNQVIINMLIGNNSNSTSESSSNQTIVCEVSNKPQYYSQPQLQLQQFSVTQQSSQSTIPSSQKSCPLLTHSSQSSYSSSSSNSHSYMNDKMIHPSSSIISEKVEIKEEDIQDNLCDDQRRFTESEDNQDDEDENEEEYGDQGSQPSSGLAKIEENCENQYEYLSSQQQLQQSYASSSQLTVSHFRKQQKLPIQQQQQKFELHSNQQQQQNQFYYYINNNSVNNNNNNNPYNNYQNLINPISQYNNNPNISLNNNNNYYNFPEKMPLYPKYSDEENYEDYMQEPPVVINSDFNESIEQRQGEEAYFYEDDYSKPYQAQLINLYGNSIPTNNYFYNNEYN